MLIKLQNKYPTNYHFRANSSWNVVEARRSEKPSKAAKRWLGKLYESSSNFSPLHFQYFTHLKLNSACKKRNFVAQQGAAEFSVATINHFSKPDFRREILAQGNEIPCAHFAVPRREMSSVDDGSKFGSCSPKLKSEQDTQKQQQQQQWQWSGKKEEMSLLKRSTRRNEKNVFNFFCFSHFFNDDA